MESLPSKNTILLDVPEVQEFSGEFQYFFWTKDEYENGLGSSKEGARMLPTETFDASYVSKTRRLPRLVKLNWKPIVGIEETVSGKVSIKSLLEKVHSEQSFTSDKFISLTYENSKIDEKIKFYLYKLAGLFAESGGVKSNNELVKVLNTNTHLDIKHGFLSEILSDMKHKGVTFDSTNSNEFSKIESLKGISTNIRINKSFVPYIAKTLGEDVLGYFESNEKTKAFLEESKKIGKQADNDSNSNLISHLDYDFEILSYVDYKPTVNNLVVPGVKLQGYLIQKIEVQSDGSIIKHQDLIVENPNTAVVFDGQVKYGSEYLYSIKAVYLLETNATDEETKQNYLVSFLVSSQFTKQISISTIDTQPPPPPVDFNLAWDFGLRALRCTWALPVNPQQDIKYIQLFRRKTIEEPFQLIKMWDFNDTNTKVAIAEYIHPELYETTKDFVGFYIDKEFNKNSQYIYALASIDAHGLTSGYSTQLQGKFNKFSNSLEKTLISLGGAPKQYPNCYLNRDTFVDTIKDSNHKSINITFNPEYLELYSADGKDLGLLKTDRDNAVYRLQIINLDLQSQQNLDVTINDYRKTSSKRKEKL